MFIGIVLIFVSVYLGLGIIFSALLYTGLLDGHRRPFDWTFLVCICVWVYAFWWHVYSTIWPDEANKKMIETSYPDMVVEDTPEARRKVVESIEKEGF